MAYYRSVRVSWDETKALANRKRHGLSFRDAAGLFQSGVDYLEIFDAEHSSEEDRFIAIGPIASGIILVVWTEWDEDGIRLISARKATK
jgi:uncharacterized DUF497 family protein